MKNTTRAGMVLLCFVMYFVQLKAQTFPYTFNSFSDTYTDLGSAAISINEGMTWDDPAYVVPLGFEFSLFGQSITELHFLGLGGVLAGADYYTISPVIIVYNSDLVDRGYFTGDPSQSPISYVLEGTAPNRIFKLEWKNAGFYDDFMDGDSYVNFQLWLYETTNTIEIRFGPREILTSVHYGLEGPIIGLHDTALDDIYTLEGPPEDPEIVTLVDFALEGDPANGQVYQFIAPPVIDVTFHVDMTTYVTEGGTIFQEGIHLAGSFQGWDPTITPMNDDGDGTWSLTLPLWGNSAHEYKFINGTNWVFAENSLPLDCGIEVDGGYINRLLEVTTSDVETPAYCFDTCEECEEIPSAVSEEELEKGFRVFPNPADDYLVVKIDLPSVVEDMEIVLVNSLGQTVFSTEFTMNPGSIGLPVAELPAGNYQVILRIGHSQYNQPLILQ
jgi:hypothetical protein